MPQLEHLQQASMRLLLFAGCWALCSAPALAQDAKKSKEAKSKEEPAAVSAPDKALELSRLSGAPVLAVAGHEG